MSSNDLGIPAGDRNRASVSLDIPSRDRRMSSTGLGTPTGDRKRTSVSLDIPSRDRRMSSTGLGIPTGDRKRTSVSLDIPSRDRRMSSTGLGIPAGDRKRASVSLDIPSRDRRLSSTGLGIPAGDRRNSSTGLRISVRDRRPSYLSLEIPAGDRKMSSLGLGLPAGHRKMSVVIEDEDATQESEKLWTTELITTGKTNADSKDGIVPKRRKSFSTTETIENFDKDSSVRLEEQIKLQHLEQLMKEFALHRPGDILIQAGSGYFPPKVQKRIPGCMNLKEFQEAIARVLGTNEYAEYLEKLFMKLDTSCDGFVDWNEFCTYMLLLYRENDYIRTKREIPFLVEPTIRHVVHNRQEATTKIVAVEGPTRYVTISKEGAMSVWQPNMAFEKSYTVASDEEENSLQKRRFKMWVTDAVYMCNCNKIAIASTSRDIRFYDVSTNQYFEEFHLFAMADVPYCFDYWFNEKALNSESLLVFGVDTGAIHLLYFLKPVTQLFDTPFKRDGGAQKIFMQDLPQHSKWVRHILLPDIHPEIICQVRYMPENDAIISSSANPKSSIVISDTKCLKKSYVFKIDKGVECFDHNKNINILVTGSADHQVRLWNPYVTNKPVAVLSGHVTGVIGVAIHEGFLQVFSYSRDAVIKVWDIKEHSCLQTVIIKFPSSMQSRMPDHGQFPLHLQHAPHDALLVTCNDYIGMLKLGQVEPQVVDTIARTHDTQLCCAIYNSFFKQVVTGCDSSSIAVWDIETGNKSIVFSNAHGDEEITAMTFDESCRRLISGARNGTIKVWNFQNGHNLHKLEPTGDAEVTGILPVTEKKVIMAVGWSRLITMYDDSDADNMYVTANNGWKGGQLHQDDILTIDYCPPNYVVTGGFDGEIIVWDLETEKVFARLRKGQATNIKKQLEDMQMNSSGDPFTGDQETRPASRPSSRPNSRHRTSHRVPKGQPIPVDKLLFLRGRASVKHTEKAMLLSSEAGIIRWWNIFSHRPEMGYFYAPDAPDESVLAMCSKPNNSLLVTGDTQGTLKLWNIMEYCLKPNEKRVKTPPPLEGYWKAHDAAVVSVEYIVHPEGEFILSASIDRTARLWTCEGRYIGTFGQSHSWNLKYPSTWSHPKTPWSREDIETAANKVPEAKEEPTEPDINKEPDQQIYDVASSDVEESNEENEDDENVESLKEAKIIKPRPKSVAVVTTSNEISVPLSLHLQFRSQTFPSGFDRTDPSKTFLGCKVEKELERKQRDRQGRRQTFGEIESRNTARFGKLCSPYQALTTPIFEEVTMPKHLPLSQRMLNKGYTSDNLTPEIIRNMDFSYGGPDTPPSSQQASNAMYKKVSLNFKAVEEKAHPKLPPIKSGKLSQMTRQGAVSQLTPLKKFHTVA